MAQKVRVVMNPKGARAVLLAAGLLLLPRGQRIAAAAGGEPDFVVTSFQGKNRARVSVITATREGMLAEARDRALTRALDAGR